MISHQKGMISRQMGMINREKIASTALPKVWYGINEKEDTIQTGISGMQSIALIKWKVKWKCTKI